MSLKTKYELQQVQKRNEEISPRERERERERQRGRRKKLKLAHDFHRLLSTQKTWDRNYQFFNDLLIVIQMRQTSQEEMKEFCRRTR